MPAGVAHVRLSRLTVNGLCPPFFGVFSAIYFSGVRGIGVAEFRIFSFLRFRCSRSCSRPYGVFRVGRGQCLCFASSRCESGMAWCKRRRSGLASLSDGLRECPGRFAMKTGRSGRTSFSAARSCLPNGSAIRLRANPHYGSCRPDRVRRRAAASTRPFRGIACKPCRERSGSLPIWTSSASGPRVSEATRIIVPIVPFRRGLPLIISDLIRLLFFFAGRTPRASVACSAAASALRFSATTEPFEYSVDRPCRRCSDNDFCYDFLHVVAPVRKDFLSDRRAETITC